jgi:Holliday junction resolvase
MQEHDLQKQIIDYLKDRECKCKDIYFMRNNSFSGQIIRADGSKGWIKNNKPGAPDIILCHGGKFIGIEVKSNKGRQSLDQKQAEKQIRYAGGEYFIVRNISEFNALVEVLNI